MADFSQIALTYKHDHDKEIRLSILVTARCDMEVMETLEHLKIDIPIESRSDSVANATSEL